MPSMDEGLTEGKVGRPRVLYSEVLLLGDPREQLFDDAKRRELAVLIEKGTFGIIVLEEAGSNPQNNTVPLYGLDQTF